MAEHGKKATRTTSEIIRQFENEIYQHAPVSLNEWVDYYHYLNAFYKKAKKIRALYKKYMKKLLKRFKGTTPEEKGRVYMTQNKETFRIKKYEIIKKMAMSYSVI